MPTLPQRCEWLVFCPSILIHSLYDDFLVESFHRVSQKVSGREGGTPRSSQLCAPERLVGMIHVRCAVEQGRSMCRAVPVGADRAQFSSPLWWYSRPACKRSGMSLMFIRSSWRAFSLQSSPQSALCCNLREVLSACCPLDSHYPGECPDYRFPALFMIWQRALCERARCSHYPFSSTSRCSYFWV
jgi:hypothetical protein